MRKNKEEFALYTLMNKNTPVLDFLYDNETHGVAKIKQIFNQKYAPLSIVDFKMGITRKKLNDWWNNRSIPSYREGLNKVLNELNMSTPVELLEKCLGFSLSDQYWIKREGSREKWEDLNFFQNDFSEDMGHFLLGQKENSKNLNLMSPDNSSDGELKKKWKIINGDRFLIKGGNSLNNQEPFNEVIATKLYERILNEGEYVPYFLINDNGKIYSACKTMISTDEELVSGLAIAETSKLKGDQSPYRHFIEACENLNIYNAQTMINKMLTCDYILANYDRHYRNFGAIRNIETLKWVKFAPLYDSGSSLWAKTPTAEIPFNEYKAKPFKADPLQQFYLVNDLTWLDENKLVGFENEISTILKQNYLMDEQRISAISKQVEKRIKKVTERKRELDHDLLKETSSKITEIEKQIKKVEQYKNLQKLNRNK